MRNQFREPIKCELRLFFMYGTTVLCKQICERSEYICLQTKYEPLWDMNVKTMESDSIFLYGFIFIRQRRSNDVGVKCLSLSLCAFHAEDSFCEKNRIGAIHIF